jgi:DNA mismatch repair protein MutS
LEEKAEGIKNFHIEIREQANTIIFLRKLKRGGSEHSFGIHVAQLAGIPNSVLLRASEILTSLEKSRSQQSQRQSLKQMESKPVYQMNMFQTDDPMFTELKKALNMVDINSITPIEALLKLQNMKKLIN